MKRREILNSLFCLVTGASFVVSSLSYSIWDRYGPEPGFLPLILGFLSSILSLTLLPTRSMGFRDGGETLAESDSLKPSEIHKTLIYLLLVVRFCFLFDRLGDRMRSMDPNPLSKYFCVLAK